MDASDSDNLPEVGKKRRRKFATIRERQCARKETKRSYDQKRISLGESFDEWQEQKTAEGFTCNSDFLKHLLAEHKARCHLLHSDIDVLPSRAMSTPAANSRGSKIVGWSPVASPIAALTPRTSVPRCSSSMSHVQQSSVVRNSSHDKQ